MYATELIHGEPPFRTYLPERVAEYVKCSKPEQLTPWAPTINEYLSVSWSTRSKEVFASSAHGCSHEESKGGSRCRLG